MTAGTGGATKGTAEGEGLDGELPAEAPDGDAVDPAAVADGAGEPVVVAVPDTLGDRLDEGLALGGLD